MKTHYQKFPTPDYRRQNDGSYARQRQSQNQPVLSSFPIPSSAFENDVYQGQEALVQSDRTISANLISLYKSLGGGWEIEPNVQAIAKATPQNELHKN